MSGPGILSAADVQDAARRLVGVTHRTPVLTSATTDAMTGARVLLKAEALQRGGSFKLRGAYNAIAQLSGAVRHRGVVTDSSGNHGQAVALAAQLFGIPATVFMPHDAPEVKLAATRGYGAEVRRYDRRSDDRAALSEAAAQEQGATVILPVDDPRVMAGHGTAALELAEEHPDLDVLVVPVGGGGLLAGSATIARQRLPAVRIVGVEPSDGDDTRRSLQAGHRVEIPPPDTIADGLRRTSPGAVTFPINQRLVDDIVTVTDPQIVDAMRWLFERWKLVVEPSGAVGVAAVLAGALELDGCTVGVLVSGGNVAAEQFAGLIGGQVPTIDPTSSRDRLVAGA
jgi:threo-3-hydroxy-L-aspartate ammonia-lyase